MPIHSASENFDLSREEFAGLKVPTAPEAAAEAIRKAIISGKLKAGDRLPEQKWAARFGIGQPTLREAFKELQYQGFVEKIGQRGTFVARLDDQDYRAILEVRLPLEAMAFWRAAARVTPAVEHELSSLILSMTTACEAADVPEFHLHDVSFHRRVWDLADNRYLKASLEALCFRLFVFSVVGRDKNWFRAAVRQHQTMLEALCSRNPEQAQRGFLNATVDYWNNLYNLGLRIEDAMSIPPTTPR